MPVPLGKIDRPTSASMTELFPELWKTKKNRINNVFPQNWIDLRIESRKGVYKKFTGFLKGFRRNRFWEDLREILIKKNQSKITIR